MAKRSFIKGYKQWGDRVYVDASEIVAFGCCRDSIDEISYDDDGEKTEFNVVYAILKNGERIILCASFLGNMVFERWDFCDKLALELGEVKELYKDPEID